MPRSEVEIVNKLGLHARPAMVFVDLASTFQAEIKVRKDDNEVDGKSIMMMMMLAAAKGSTIVVDTDGADADQAMTAIQALIADKFGEGE